MTTNVRAQANNRLPAIVSPAGDKACFLAAIAAGADTIYCGLTRFSARTRAGNFSAEQLAPLADLAHEENVRVNVALNSLVKPDEIDEVGRLLDQITKHLKIDGIIIQDLAMLRLARERFAGEIHLSTLANVSFPQSLALVKSHLGVDGVVVPRELSIEEIRSLAQACPDGLGLEVFVHGALCYGISGRCYWSSFLGGKSGLKGSCVQPCRRLYSQDEHRKRFFSCIDLSLDVLAKLLLSMPQINAWKIEGRKKGPHYVYHITKAYKIFRDHGDDPQAKKEALEHISWALGRQGTHYRFLPHRVQAPIKTDAQTGSGLLIGAIHRANNKTQVKLRKKLLKGDTIRIGYEDEPWHFTLKVPRDVPNALPWDIPLPANKTPKKAVPVFLVDRRDKELERSLIGLEEQLKKQPGSFAPSSFKIRLPNLRRLPKLPGALHEEHDLYVYRGQEAGKPQRRPKGSADRGFWVTRDYPQCSRQKADKRVSQNNWWWLPPVIWPDEEAAYKNQLDMLVAQGCRRFVLNAPWQRALFPDIKGLTLWAGPFCNLANPLAIEVAASLGFAGAIISPELSEKDYVSLPVNSSLPLGIVLSGNWPLCLSRTSCNEIEVSKPFHSPKGEAAWLCHYDQNFWIYPNWKLDLSAHKASLHKAGYRLFVHLIEPIAKDIELKRRPGEWNWRLGVS